MTELNWNVYRWPPVRFLFRKAHSVILPGLNGASLFEVGKFFVKELNNLKLKERAAMVTYNFIMALPPTFLFLFSLLPYLPIKNVEQTILYIIKLLTPNNKVYDNVHSIVQDFMVKQHHDVLSYGIILVIFFSSNGMMGLMRSFDKSLSLYVKRSALQRRWTAVKLTFMMIGVSIAGLAVLIMQSKKLNPMVLKIFKHVVAVKVLSFIILILMVFVTISLIYTYGPSLRRKFKFVSAGSVFATLASITATAAFFFMINHFINYNKVYGSIGSLIAFMIWIWLNTIIILLGYELNVSILLGKLSKGEIYEDE